MSDRSNTPALSGTGAKVMFGDAIESRQVSTDYTDYAVWFRKRKARES